MKVRVSSFPSRAGRILVPLVVALSVLAPSALAGINVPTTFPVAGDLVKPGVSLRTEPAARSKVIRVLQQFRPDYHFQVILILGAKKDATGKWWYKISFPARPNGQRAWIKAKEAEWWTVPNRIVVHRESRYIEVVRMSDGKQLLKAPVAVGKPGAETPLGRDFFVQSRFVPTNTFLGTFALETSAYSRLTDWPGGGVAGIHGTSVPQLLGQAVSHGCIRIPNWAADKMKALAPLGTPIDILAD